MMQEAVLEPIKDMTLVGQRIGAGTESDVFEYGKDQVVKFPRQQYLNTGEYLEQMRSVYIELKTILGDHLPDMEFHRLVVSGNETNVFFQRKICGRNICSILDASFDTDKRVGFLEDEQIRNSFTDFIQKIKVASLRLGVLLDMAQDNIWVEDSGKVVLVDVGGLPVVQSIMRDQTNEYPDLQKIVAEGTMQNIEELERWDQALKQCVDMNVSNEQYGIDEAAYLSLLQRMKDQAKKIIER